MKAARFRRAAWVTRLHSYQQARGLSDAEVGQQHGISGGTWTALRQGYVSAGTLTTLRVYKAHPALFGHVCPVSLDVGENVADWVRWLVRYQEQQAWTDRQMATALSISRNHWSRIRLGGTQVRFEGPTWRKLVARFPEAFPRVYRNKAG